MVVTRKRRRLQTANAGTASGVSYIAVSPTTARLYRLQASHLLPTTRVTYADKSLAQLCASLFGLQAQETTAAALSLYNRLKCGDNVPVPNLSELRAAFSTRTAEHGIVRCHGQRCTLHIYDVATWPIAAAAVRDRILDRMTKRNGHENMDAAYATLSKRIAAGRDVTAKDLAGSEFPLRYYAFMSITFRGLGARTDISGGVVISPRKNVVPAQSPKWKLPTVDEAVRHAAKVYFSSFGPATEQDFRYYMGLTAGVSRDAVSSLHECGDLVEVRIDCSDEREALGLSASSLIAVDCAEKLNSIERVQERQGIEALPLLLLGKYDVLLLGHKDKSWIVPPSMKPRVWSQNAIVRAVVIARGRAQGTWSYSLSGNTGGSHLKVSVELFPGADWKDAVDMPELNVRVERLAEEFFASDSWEVHVETID